MFFEVTCIIALEEERDYDVYMKTYVYFLFSYIWFAQACASATETKTNDDAKDTAFSTTEKQEVVEQPEYPLVQEEDIVVAITDREQLQNLEKSFGFAQLLPHNEDMAFSNEYRRNGSLITIEGISALHPICKAVSMRSALKSRAIW